MTAHEIRDDGAKALSEQLKKNTTLKKLNLYCEEERNGKEKKKKDNEWMIGGFIGAEGQKAMGEMLKVNTTLTELNLGGEGERKEKEKSNMNE